MSTPIESTPTQSTSHALNIPDFMVFDYYSRDTTILTADRKLYYSRSKLITHLDGVMKESHGGIWDIQKNEVDLTNFCSDKVLKWLELIHTLWVSDGIGGAVEICYWAKDTKTLDLISNNMKHLNPRKINISYTW